MKKLLLIFAFALIGCTADEKKTECECFYVESGLINGANPWRIEGNPYSNDCSDNGKVLYEGVEWHSGNRYDIFTKVECR